MQTLIHQQVNVISFVTLVLFMIYANIVLEKQSVIRRLYLSAVGINLYLTLSDVLFCIIVENNNLPLVLLRLIREICFILSPLLAYSFLLFVCNCFVYPYRIKKQTGLVFYFLFLVNTVATIFSYNTDLFISVRGTKGNMLTTGYVFPFSLSIILLLYSIWVIYKRRKMLLGFEYFYMVSTSSLTTAIVAIQMLLNKTEYMWSLNSFILILMFIVIQQKELYRDPLTSARNRLALEKCLDSHNKHLERRLSAVMIDLDYFKNINDSYGHSEGDFVLKAFVKMLQRAYFNSGIVFRTGGDEFLILVYNKSETEIVELMKKMSGMVDKFNSKGVRPYKMRYSYASGTYKKSDMSIPQFLHEIDLQMYNNKNGKKSSSGESLKSGFYAGNL